ncbi:MAG: hypothetical protein DRQ61_00220 [Gammaproteobacteria bacterium]|nr:MAG: hypothetical protein DRQ56_03285 [Gammaproteobacteria bacterium]RLA24619.1 MAG: hypothetical protein DRQ61_00220 [Gammaproteobacteria bacterium]
MKINIEVDATPQELRTFFGLPHIEVIQEEMLKKMREKMLENIDSLDVTKMMSQFMPENIQSLEGVQKSFWDAMMGQMASATKK